MYRRCLYCYRPLAEGETDMHQACIRKFFGTKQMPAFDYSAAQMDELAAQIIRDRTSLTGVQPKLSLHIMEHEGRRRLTIVGLWGAYICKPQTPMYAALPEIEDLTMHLAEAARISVVPHSLMRMDDGTLCYLTRRVDRTPEGGKIAMEDMCQLTGRLTEDKYRKKLHNMATVIKSMAQTNGRFHTLLGVSEIENRLVLEDLVSQPEIAAANYQIVHYDGPDARGVDVALLYCVLVLRQPNNDEDLLDDVSDEVLGKSNRDISEQDIINAMNWSVCCIGNILRGLASPSSSVGRAPGS